MLLDEKMQIAKDITYHAEQKIYERVGVRVKLVMVRQTDCTPDHLLQVIASTLSMSMDDYKIKSRKHRYVDLRCIGAFLLKQNFDLSYVRIAELFGGQDHTTVINTITRYNERIETMDAPFMKKAMLAANAVNDFLTACDIHSMKRQNMHQAYIS